MTKTMITSPPDKRVGKKKIACPSITRHENTLWRDLCDGTVAKFNRVEVTSTPSIVSELFRQNYETVFGHK